MVSFTCPSDPGDYPSYYRTRRTPFIALGNQEEAKFESEIIPEYSEHDARIKGEYLGGQLAIEQARTQRSVRNDIQGSSRQSLDKRSQAGHRGAQDTTYVIEEHIPAGLYEAEGQSYQDQVLVERSSRRRELHSSENRALSRRSASCQREARGPPTQALVKRSSSCSREVQALDTHRAGVQEYTKNGGPTQEYVVEEHIPAEFNYRTPTKAEKMELDYNNRRAVSVPPNQDSPPGQLIKILPEPGYLYYVPLRLDDSSTRPELQQQQTYYDKRRAVFTEPQGTDLKHYTFSILPPESDKARQLRSSSYDNSLDRTRISQTHTRDNTLKQQIIYEDASTDVRQDSVSNVKNTSNELALVPIDRSQTVPPLRQQEYSSKWIKIPDGPTTIKVYPTISSNDPNTWTHTYDKHDSQQNKKQPTMEIVKYELIPKQEIEQGKRYIETDQRYDRSHKDNRGAEYRPKFVNFRRGPSPFIYSSIHAMNEDACTNPALSGYVGNANYQRGRERSKKKEILDKEESAINKSYMANTGTSKVNRILNTREDFEKKHLVDMLFEMRHILKEREALGEYEIPPRIKNKLNYLTTAVQYLTPKNRNQRVTRSLPRDVYRTSYENPQDSAASFLKVSSMMAPIRPIHSGRSNALMRYRYMMHEPRIL